MKKQAIDVIIPTYNGMPYLRDAVESVLNQTHKELILYIIDDGSTDETEKYVKSMQDKRVRYHKKTNGGQSTARNLGISISDSPYVALLDADDIWYPNKLEKQIKLIQSNKNLGMVYGHHYIIDEDSIITGNLRHWEKGRIFDKLCEGNCISGSASMVLIKREVFNKLGTFKEDFLIGEDWEMWLRIAKYYEIDFVPEIIAALRQRSDGMQQNNLKMARGLDYMLDIMKKDLNLNDEQYRKLATYCLYHASVGYMAAGKRYLARKSLVKLFHVTPSTIFKFSNWKINIAVGIYSKIIFGNPVFDYIFRTYIYFEKIFFMTIKKIIKFIRYMV